MCNPARRNIPAERLHDFFCFRFCLKQNRRKNHNRNRNEIFVQSSDWTNMKYAAVRHMKCTTGFYPESSVHEIFVPTCAGTNMLEPAPSRRLLYRWEDRCWAFLIVDIRNREDSLSKCDCKAITPQLFILHYLHSSLQKTGALAPASRFRGRITVGCIAHCVDIWRKPRYNKDIKEGRWRQTVAPPGYG